MKKLIIIGGGIAGLAAAYRVQEAIAQGSGSLQCTVLEGSGRFGGKIHTERQDGFILERGPDSFISQKPWAIQLCQRLGIGDQLVGTCPDNPKTYVYLNKKMITLPDGLSLMVPTKFMPFVTTRLFSWPGKVRMGMDLFIPARRDNGDESLAGFVRRRLGEEAVQRLAQPMLAGIYAGDPETMSLRATFPMFARTEEKYRSLILGMLAQKRQRAGAPPKQNSYSAYTMFMTLKDGMSTLVDTLLAKSPDIHFKSGARVEVFERAGPGWRLGLESGEALDADAVIVATPANQTAPLLHATAPRATELLNRIQFVSTAAVALGYRRERFDHRLDGFGFVVPSTERRRISACTWVSSKFPGRAPEGHVLLRAFVGGALNEPLAEQEPETIAAMVQDELKDIMGVRAEPLFCKVYQYRKGNVQYRVNHPQLVAEVERVVKEQPGLYLAGSAYHGIGVPDCVQDGTRAAEAALQFLEQNVPAV